MDDARREGQRGRLRAVKQDHLAAAEGRGPFAQVVEANRCLPIEQQKIFIMATVHMRPKARALCVRDSLCCAGGLGEQPPASGLFVRVSKTLSAFNLVKING